MEINLSYSENHLRNFLLDHPAINISKIEMICKIPKDTLRHFVKSRRNISEKYLEIIICQLERYGYKSMDSE